METDKSSWNDFKLEKMLKYIKFSLFIFSKNIVGLHDMTIVW